MAKEVELTPGYERIAREMVATVSVVAETLRKQVTKLVTICRKTYGGNEVPKADLNAIADQVADECGWKGASLKVRKSEVRSLVAAYASLEVAADKYEKKTGTIGYHALVNLSRKLRDSTPAQAVDALLTRTPNQQAKAPAVAIQSAAKSLSKVKARAGTMPRKFLDDFAKLCAKHGIAFE